MNLECPDALVSHSVCVWFCSKFMSPWTHVIFYLISYIFWIVSLSYFFSSKNLPYSKIKSPFHTNIWIHKVEYHEDNNDISILLLVNICIRIQFPIQIQNKKNKKNHPSIVTRRGINSEPMVWHGKQPRIKNPFALNLFLIGYFRVCPIKRVCPRVGRMAAATPISHKWQWSPLIATTHLCTITHACMHTYI